MAVLDRACPFCGGPESITVGNERICAYCLQPYDLTEGALSEGYNKLASYNFTGAAEFFRSVIDTEGDEAAYGLFLAKNKIEENKQRSTIEPIVYSYHAESFYNDPDFVLLLKAYAGNRVYTKKLEKIEQARLATLKPKEECHAVVFYDGEKANECDGFCEYLTASGYEVLKTNTAGADIATLREAGGAYYFAANAEAVNAFLRTKIARRYLLLESERTHEAGIAKRPLKIIIGEELPDSVADAAFGIADIVPFADCDAEVRRLRYLTSDGSSGVRAGLREKIAPAAGATKPQRNSELLPEIRGEEADIERMRRLIFAGKYSDARGVFEKMRKSGCRAGKAFFCAFLAGAEVSSEENLVKYADSIKLSAETLSLLLDALYYGTEQEAKKWVALLVDVSLSLLDRRRKKEAASLLDAAFAYDYSDEFADKILGRINALKSGMTVDEYVSLRQKVLTSLSSDDVGYKLKKVYETIDYAISRGEFGRADDIVDSVLDFYPYEPKLYARKLFCVNRVGNFNELLSREYPMLGGYFADYLASLGEGDRRRTLKDFFDSLVKSAQTKGFEGFEVALGEVYDAGGKDLFGARECVTIGELALTGGIFAAAEGYFDKAVLHEKECYAAYWGRLKAELKCASDRALEESDIPVDTVGRYYEKAYYFGACDLDFIKRIEKVREVQKTVSKKDGHVYRPDDFIVRGGTAVKYIGTGGKIYVGGGITAVGENAFRGCGVKSVLLGDGVKNIGAYAFAYSDIENIVLPSGLVAVGVNPFLGCRALAEISGGGAVIDNGAFYSGGKLVGYYEQMADDPTRLEVRKGTYAIGQKAFYRANKLREVKLNSGVKPEICAFYGCEGLKISGTADDRTSAFGEGIFGDCVSAGGVLVKAGGETWSSLYRDGTNNMASDAPLKKGELTKVIDTCGNLGGGLLIKNGKIIYTVGSSLIAEPIGGTAKKSEIRLPSKPSGTGVLWNEYVILPAEECGGSLLYVSPDGKTEYAVALKSPITRPLAVGGDRIACVCGDTLSVVDLGSGRVRSVRTGERLTSTPCYAGGKFVVAGEKHVYAYTAELIGGAVRELRGKDFHDGTGRDKKICRGRIVSYGGVAYWMELGYSNSVLAYYDGERVYTKNLPASSIYFVNTQPIFYGGKLYCASEYAVVSSPVPAGSEDWSFSEGENFSRKFSELAVAGGKPYLCYADGEYRNLRFRALYDGKAVLYDIAGGGVYFVGI